MPLQKKRKQHPPSASLGVLEFASALNGDDAILIIQKLHQFVKIVKYERFVSLSSPTTADGTDIGGDGIEEEGVMQEDDDEDVENSDTDSSILSFDSTPSQSTTKRQKLNNNPSWQSDTKNYAVPFVGTSLSKGSTGTIIVGEYPTGLLKVYYNHSMNGVELLSNSYLSNLNGGIYKELCKDSDVSFTVNSGGGEKKKGSGETKGQSKGKLLSIKLQTIYWNAISEWILGYVDVSLLKREMFWEEQDDGVGGGSIARLDNVASAGDSGESKSAERRKQIKCTVPPSVMTILMKERLPEWIETIHKYIAQQQKHLQRIQKESKKQKKIQQQQQQKVGQKQQKDEIQTSINLQKKQQREEALLLSSMNNIIALCHLSNGTAREVLRKLTIVPSSSNKATTNNTKGGKFNNKNVKSEGGDWLVQLLQVSFSQTKSRSSYQIQIQCIRLVCILFETQDYMILSKLCEAPTASSSSGSKGRGKSNTTQGNEKKKGLAYIALRYGIQALLEGEKISTTDSDKEEDGIKLYAQYMVRLLRNIRTILLSNDNGDNDLEVNVKADLLSGEVLNNLTRLSNHAPEFNANAESIRSIINGNDMYEDLDLTTMEVASVEARRIVFLLLADSDRSPFLCSVHHKAKSQSSTNAEEQSQLYLSQLSKVLHNMLGNQGGHDQSTKLLLELCLKTTPELVPHFIKGLQLSTDLKPTYRSLAALTFVEGVLREAPIQQQFKSESVDQLLSTIVPPCVSKTLLGKVIQSPSALLVSAGLKLIITILHRAQGSITSLTTEASNQVKDSLSQAVMRHLPEVSLLLSIPSRFDPFEVTSSSSSPNGIVVLQLCEALQCYSTLDTLWMADIKFDWTKLVPNDEDEGRMFSNAEPLLQHRILQTLIMVSSHQSRAQSSSKMLPSILSIVVSTQVPEVYKSARELAILLMERELFTQDSSTSQEIKQCHDYETSLWVDGISPNLIQEVVSMIEEMKQQRVQHKITVSQAWSKAVELKYWPSTDSAVMPPLGVSSLLLSSVFRMMGSAKARKHEVTRGSMDMLLIQITIKMLLFQVDPKPLAAVIACSTSHSLVGHYNTLLMIALGICKHSPDSFTAIKGIAPDLFHPNCHLNYLAQMLQGPESNNREKICIDDTQPIDSTTLRQFISMVKYSQGKVLHPEKLNTLIQKMLVSILETGRDVSKDISILAAMFNSQTLKSVNMESNLILLMSAAKQSGLEVGSSSSNHDAESTKAVSMGLVSELLRSSLNPGKNESTFVDHICKYCLSAFKSNDTTDPRLKDLLLTLLLNILPSKDDSSPLSIPPGMMFDLWAGIAKVETNHLNADYQSTVELSRKCCLRLEERLVDVFDAKNDQGAWVVYQRVCSLNPNNFLSMWVVILQNVDEMPSYYGTSLLQSLLKYDCSEFSCLSSEFIERDELTPKMKKFFSDSRLDAVRATFVLQTYKQRYCKAVLEDESFVKAASIIGRSLMTCLLGERDLSEGVSHGMIIEVMETLCSNQLLLSETQEMLIEAFKRLDKGSLVFEIDLEIQLMKLAVYVESARDTKVSSLLLTISFIRCCKVLPKHIKRMMRSQKKAEADVVESLVDSLSSMIELSSSFDDETLALSSKLIDSCIIACLKYGMMESSEGLSAASGGCLKTIRLLMSLKQGVLGIIRPSQIHAMAVSHSSFQSTLSGNKAVKLELIHLLLCTLSLDCKHVKVESETWATILSAYNAGTDVADRSLRRLMFLYEQHDCGKDEVMMNDLRWGRLSKDQTEKVGEDESWEWLINAVDLDRVQSTLSQFPVADTLEPTSISDIECSTTKMMQDEQEESSSVSEDDDMTDDDESSNDSATSTSPSTKTQGNDQWRGSGDDIRYSPGFVLPLMLAALEANLPQEDEKETPSLENNNEEDNDSNEQTNLVEFASRRAYGNFCRRLADKGGIALAITSLSSRCPSIRKVAVAICGFFLKALQMPESQGLKSWRERPQQEVILNSIQRGLAVRRAIQIQKQDNQDGIELGGMTSTQRFNIPMLPAVSAVFLAKAMLILSQPRHDMYGQMNRFFLRLSDYHGAFQDCFGLPAFLLLYCSSSDELSRCWTERNWALQTLKDGAVDEYCYRIISQHHVPELIMSSFDSLIDNPESQSEVYLTIDVLDSLLQTGTRALDHLINRQGFLSWLHGILSWREVSSTLPSETLRCKFLNLITTAVSSYGRLVSSQDNGEVAFYEKIPLSNVVIRICLSGGDHSDVPTNTLLEPSACNALWEIYLADKELQSTTSYLGSTNLSDMTALLKKYVHYPELFEKVLASVCDLPMALGDDELSARIFCGLALSYMLEKKTDHLSDSIVLTMKRVHGLIQLYPSLKDDKEITAKIINCRRLVVSVEGGIELWNMFSSYL